MDTGGWMATLQNNSLANLRAYGRWVGNRYKNFDNIVWLHGDDFQNWRMEADRRQGARSWRWASRTSTRGTCTPIQLDFKLSSSLDDVSWAPIIGDRRGVHLRPHVCGDPQGLQPAQLPARVHGRSELRGGRHLYLDTGTPETLRRQEYWTALSGAAGQLFGNEFIWQFLSGWQTPSEYAGRDSDGVSARRCWRPAPGSTWSPIRPTRS